MSILTLTKYKAYKNINSDKDDTTLTNIISSVNAFIKSYCGRDFTGYYSTEKTEYFDSNDTEVYPSEYPLVSVTSVSTSTDGGQTYTDLVPYTDYIVDVNNSRIVSNYDTFVYTYYPINSIRVIYKGGYETIPADLLLAAVNLVEYYVDSQYTASKQLSGASVDNIIITDNTARLPAHIRRVLEHHRSVNL